MTDGDEVPDVDEDEPWPDAPAQGKESRVLRNKTRIVTCTTPNARLSCTAITCTTAKSLGDGWRGTANIGSVTARVGL